ncbi:MAG: hypothetical protein RI549_08315 [Wenzhouxiangella sp.]|nr:hypothetical protein [Wenzhouxiangella sp.]
MSPVFKTAVVVVMAAVLSGCATPARISGMVASYDSVEAPADAYLRDSIRVGQVTGGKETNPMWTSQVDAVSFRAALERSLEQAGLFNNSDLADHYLNAQLVELDQPLFGTSLTVKATVRYELIHAPTERVVYEQMIERAHTAKFSDAFIGVERLKLANEGAVRVNIETLIADLYEITPSHTNPKGNL